MSVWQFGYVTLRNISYLKCVEPQYCSLNLTYYIWIKNWNNFYILWTNESSTCSKPNFSFLITWFLKIISLFEIKIQQHHFPAPCSPSNPSIYPSVFFFKLMHSYSLTVVVCIYVYVYITSNIDWAGCTIII